VILAHGRTHASTNILASIRDVVLDGLVKEPDLGHIRIWKDSGTHGTVVEVNNMLRSEMHADVCAKRNHVDMKIPNSARHSYDGSKQLIAVKHFLKITLVTRDKPGDPHVLIPIKILDPPIETAMPHTSSQGRIKEVATTVWPEDPVPAGNHHLVQEDTTEGSLQSCPVIQEVPQAE
jgi:hypothetical protein